MEVKRSNPKALETLTLKLKELEGVQGKTGWFETAKYPNGTSVAYVAAIQELGYSGGKTFTIPPRPTMRPTAIAKRQEWAETAAEGAREMLKTPALRAVTVMTALTLKAKGDILESISKLYAPPLSKVTLELRAMKKRNPGLKITRGTVWQAIGRVKSPGYTAPTGVSDKPLLDSRLMFNTLDNIVEQK